MPMHSGSLQKKVAFRGSRAGSVMGTQQFRCGCGHLFPIRVARSVDSASDVELCKRATESALDSALHVAHCEACGQSQVISVPFTYHDGASAIFALVLPEAWRFRELEERAALLLELAAEGLEIPDYVLAFEVVYGPAGLKEHLRLLRVRDQQEDQGRHRLRDIEARLEEAAVVERRIEERERALANTIAELDRRSSSLTERELGLHDRKGALDRRSEELERKTAALEEAKIQLRAESQGELPHVLNEDQTVALDEESILTSAPDLSTEGRVRSQATEVSGSSGEFKSAVQAMPEGLEEMVAPLEADNPSAAETRVAPAMGESVGRSRALSDIVTGEHSVRDTEPRLGRVVSSLQEIGSGGMGAGAMPPATEVGEHDVTVPSSSDPDITAWRQQGGKVLKLLRGQDLRLAASLNDAALEELMASDIRALLQLHRMPGYPLVSLTLARATTLADEGGQPFSFHFDIAVPEDRQALEALANDFRFTLDLYDQGHRPMRQRRLAAPLAGNVRYVMTLAADARKSIAPRARSFQSAVNAFDNDRYDRLGRTHALAREFRDSLLDKIAKPADLHVALQLCEKFSEPAGEEYLVAIRSYPFDRWHKRRLQVIKRAVDLGIWMGPTLARVAVSEELVRSRKELASTCLKNFADFSGGGASAMTRQQIDANWAALRQEATELGLRVPGQHTSELESEASGTIRPAEPRVLSSSALIESDEVLLKQLREPEARLQSIIALCDRKTLPGVDPLFRALAELPFDEAAEAFAAVTKLGNQATEPLLVLLTCPSAHLRHGAAMALCELGNDEAVDIICEDLMKDEGSMWREYAVALGRVGSSAIMPIVARLRSQGKRAQARAVWTLGYIAAQGARKPVETLANGRDAKVAQTASSALELMGRLQKGDIVVERSASEQLYSESFYRALTGEQLGYASSEMSGPAMLLDDTDLIEAME